MNGRKIEGWEEDKMKSFKRKTRRRVSVESDDTTSFVTETNQIQAQTGHDQAHRYNEAVLEPVLGNNIDNNKGILGNLQGVNSPAYFNPGWNNVWEQTKQSQSSHSQPPLGNIEYFSTLGTNSSSAVPSISRGCLKKRIRSSIDTPCEVSNNVLEQNNQSLSDCMPNPVELPPHGESANSIIPDQISNESSSYSDTSEIEVIEEYKSYNGGANSVEYIDMYTPEVFVYGMETYQNMYASKKPRRKYNIWPSSLPETDDEEDNCNKKQKVLAERMKQSLVVSQVAEKLELHARRAEEAIGIRKGRRGRRPNNVVAPPQVDIYHETLKYHALTYDDEVYEGGDDGDVYEMNENKCVKTSDVPTIGALVTDDSDSSEEDDSATTLARKHNTVSGNANLNLGTARNNDNKMSNKPNARYHLPPVSNPRMIASINRKLLHGIVMGQNNFIRVDYEPGVYNLVSAAIAYFCMTTPPLDFHLDQRIEHLIRTCHPLAVEFERYVSALIPLSEKQEHQHRYLSPVDRLLRCPIGDCIKEFKTFAVNWIEKILLSGDGLSHEESKALHNCVRNWMESSMAQV